MKFAYVTKAKIPSTSASSINIMQSCEAITELGIDIKLFYPFKINYPFNVFRNIFEYYGIKKKFKVSKYIPQYSHRASLFYKIVSNKCKREERIVYTRDILFLSYCTEYKLSAIWECHFPPK